MAIERWKTITTKVARESTKDKPVLLSDGVTVWLGWFETNGSALESDGAGWTDGQVDDWRYQLMRVIGPTHYRSRPTPPRRPRNR